MTYEASDDDEVDALDLIVEVLSAHGIVEPDDAVPWQGAYRLTALGKSLDVQAVLAFVNLPTHRNNAN